MVMSDVAAELWCCSRCSAIYRKDFPFCPADGGEIVRSEVDPLVGQTIDHYTIESLIGEGSMGRVYRAHHAQLVERVYAVKVLIGDLAATQESRIRFVNEAKSASRLDHRNVVSVVDVGRSPKGLLYLVMEHVVGTPLSHLLKEPMEPFRAARLVRDVCRGLGCAHDKGIVHRDLKPDNILITRDDDGNEVPRIVDFGIAVHVAPDARGARLTATGTAIGTPAYIAPEQATGDRVDARADQYSVGVTLFELLTGGRLPFEGAPHDVVNSKVRATAPSLDHVVPRTIPFGLVRIVERMLARDARDRYTSIHEVVRLLTRFLEAPETVISDDRSSRAKYAALGVLGVAAIVGGAAFVLAKRDPDPPHRNASVIANARPTSPAENPPMPPVEVPPTPIARADSPPDPAVSMAIEKPPTEERPRQHREKRKRHTGRKQERTPDEKRPAEPVVATLAPPPTFELPAAPSVDVKLPARIDSIDVAGGLSSSDVQRALRRVTPAIGRCTAPTVRSARVRFTIDDSRRARDIQGSGAPDETLSCVTRALGELRTESAPDVGSVEVVLQIGFRGSS